MAKIQTVYRNKPGETMNEDELLVKDNLFAVFDGATSIIPFRNKEGKTGGRIGAEIVKEVFSQNNKSLRELAIEANYQLKEKMEHEKIDLKQKEGLWMVGAVVVRLLDREAEFFQISDCFILAIFKNGSFQQFPRVIINRDLETLRLWERLAAQKIKNIRAEIREQNTKVRREANVTYGFLTGEKAAERFFEFGKIPLKNVKSLVLFTDGLLIPKKIVDEPENWPLFIELYRKSGLEGIANYVRRMEETDPYCWQYPRLKQYDDIAAIGIDFY